MKYKEAISLSMKNLAKDKKRIFLGYNVAFGSKGYGTLEDISREQVLETPLAENLMVDLGIGMSLEGYKPLIFFERHDFILNALDAIVNHADKLNKISSGQYNSPLIIRATVGASRPLNPGPQHTQDFTEAFRYLLGFPIFIPKSASEVLESYNTIKTLNHPSMIIEKKELYNFE